MAKNQREVILLEPIKLEIQQNKEGLWLINVDGISVASSHFEVSVRRLAEEVVELNPDVEFEIVD